MLLLLLACGLFPSSECRGAREAQAAAWRVSAELAAAEADRLTVEARGRHQLAAQADAAEKDVPAAPEIETSQLDVSQESYTRSLVAGGTLAEAATAAQRAELALRTRKVLVAVEAETRRTEALTARIDGWRAAEAAWRDAGGLYVLSRQLYATKAGEGVTPGRAPLQAGDALVEPALPAGSDPMDEEIQGAQKAHAGRRAAEDGAIVRHDKLKRVLDRGADLLVEVSVGAAADAELRSTENEARLVLGRANAALAALDAAQKAGEALDQDGALPLPATLAAQLDSAQAQARLTTAACE